MASSATLLAAARAAGVRRVVHVSVVNAAPDADTPYVRAKAALESVVRSSGLEWVIVRPPSRYGPGDILINNLAWALRRLPVYGMAGLGRYTVQPVHVDDVRGSASRPRRASPAASSMPPARSPRRTAGWSSSSAARSAADRSSSRCRAVVAGVAKLLGLVVRDVVLTRTRSAS